MYDTNPFRYCGEYYDSETKALYLRARYYDASTGRFTQQDDWKYAKQADPLSLNLYTYCENNPILYCDPNGHMAITTIIFLGSLTVGFIAALITAHTSYKYTGKVDWENTIITGLSWFSLAYTVGTSAYGLYLSYCNYKGYTPVTEVNFNGNTSAGNANATKTATWANGQTFEDVKNKANHIFHNNEHEHHLNGFLNTFQGNEIDAYTEMTARVQEYVTMTGATDIKYQVFNINGFDIVIDAQVINGLVRIKTAFLN